MDIITNSLSERTISSFPISIGTSISLESIAKGNLPAYDPDRVIPNEIDITKYDYFYVNLVTLFRNIIGAINKVNIEQLSYKDVSDILEFEIDIIKDVIKNNSFGKTKVIAYASMYKDIEKTMPHALIKIDNTDKQKKFSYLMQKTINHYFTSVNKENNILFERDIIPEKQNNALILTSYSYDLLSYNKFNNLDLLESHTGVLKPRNMWYTKLSKAKDLNRIPFNKCFLQIFGDSTLFTAFPVKVRQSIIDLSEKYNWTQTTTKDRLFFSFDTLSDAYLKTILKSMF